MRTRLSLGLVLVLILALSIGLAGCKITGGGFLDECDGKVNFGFNAQFKGDDVKGQFQLVDHSTKPVTRVHGTFEGQMGSAAGGLCTVNGLGPYPFSLYVEDEGEPGIDDYISVRIYIPGPDLKYKGTIDGGNIQVHKDD